MFKGSTWLHAPPLHRRFSSASLPPPSSKRSSSHFHMASFVRIAVVGDVHDDWNLQEDSKALQTLKPDLVLFTGDFGNENVDLVRSIADLTITKAVILGNHDAWRTRKFSAKEKDGVQLQLECLGDDHVGYRRKDIPELKLSVVGGRPFSAGGEQLFRKKLLIDRYGVQNMDGSAKRICETALGTPEGHSVIFLAHNGPTGLGSKMDDICGRDWVFGGGDHGDPDLERAISQLKEKVKLYIPLVVFGHMHKELASSNGVRKMVVVGDDDIVYLNGAIVPRVRRLQVEEATSTNNCMVNEGPSTTWQTEATVRAFTVVDIANGRLERIAETWVSVNGEKSMVEEEHILFSRATRGSDHSS